MQTKVMPSRSNVFVAATAAVVALFAVSNVASAGDSKDEVRVEVNYADLNLETNAGIAELHGRLRVAAKQACDVRTYVETRSLRQVAIAKACYEETLEAAIQRVNNKRLTAYVNERSSTPSI